MKRWLVVVLLGGVLLPGAVRGDDCSAVPPGDPRWQRLDEQYARIERAMVASDTTQLFAVYAPDFEAHTPNGEVWSFQKSAAYSTAGFEQVKENVSISDMILNLTSCGPTVLQATVLQQWSRRQLKGGTLRLCQTTTVQDETWVLLDGEWKRKLVDRVRPGAWLIDLKRVDPTKAYDPEAPPFDPHGLLGVSKRR